MPPSWSTVNKKKVCESERAALRYWYQKVPIDLPMKINLGINKHKQVEIWVGSVSEVLWV